MTDLPKYITRTKAAEVLGVSQWTLIKWEEGDGELRDCIFRFAGTVKYDVSRWLAWIEKHHGVDVMAAATVATSR